MTANFPAGLGFGLALALLGASPGMAQAPPGTFSPLAPLQPPVNPTPVGPAAPAPRPLPPTAVPDVARSIQDVVVEGVTAYPPDVLAGLTSGLTGPAVPQPRIEAAREAINNRYREDGFVYTTVNAVISGAHLRFVVTEGHITDVKLDGDIGPAGTQVLRFLNNLTEVRPVSISDIERWLLLASDVPGVTIRSVLNPSTSEPGALTLVAQVSRQAVSGLFTSDNRAFRETGPQEALAILDFNSFTEFGEKTELQLYQTYNGTQTFGQASSEVFLGGSGLKLRLYGGAGPALPTGELGTIGYFGFTTVFGAQLSYPVIRSRSQNLNVGAYFDALESNIDTDTGVNGAPTRSSFDSLRVVRVGADYALFDVLLGADHPATNGVAGRLSQGLSWLGASRNGSLDAPRLGEKIDFTKFAGQASRTQTLFRPWEEASVALQATIAGQYSGDLLPPAEQFYLGGPHFNRGYYYGQVTGDKALATSLELQLNTPIPLPRAIPLELTSQFYGFYDWGETWQNQQLDPNRVLQSVGGGVRLYPTNWLEIDFEGVARFNRFPNGGGTNVSALPTGAFYWQFLARF